MPQNTKLLNGLSFAISAVLIILAIAYLIKGIVILCDGNPTNDMFGKAYILTSMCLSVIA